MCLFWLFIRQTIVATLSTNSLLETSLRVATLVFPGGLVVKIHLGRPGSIPGRGTKTLLVPSAATPQGRGDPLPMSVRLHFLFISHLRQDAAVTIQEGGWPPSFIFSLNEQTVTELMPFLHGIYSSIC